MINDKAQQTINTLRLAIQEAHDAIRTWEALITFLLTYSQEQHSIDDTKDNSKTIH